MNFLLILLLIACHSTADRKFNYLLDKIHAEKSIQTIVYYNCSQFTWSTQPELPQLYLSAGAPVVRLKKVFNINLLVWICVQAAQGTLELFNGLAETLDLMRQVRIVLASNNETLEDLRLPYLAELLNQHYMSNLLVLDTNNFITNGSYWQLKPFPYFHFTQQQLNSSMEIYETHWRNMQGRKLITLPDQIIPRSLVYYNPAGELQLTGYVGKLAQLFAKHYNAQLEYAWPVYPDDVYYLTTLVNYTLNRTLDFPISVSSYFTEADFQILSYPYELSQWFVIVPCPRPISTAEIYKGIVSVELVGVILLSVLLLSVLKIAIKLLLVPGSIRSNHQLVTDILVNAKVWPGILGQSFVMSIQPIIARKLTYLVISVMGLIISTLYGSFLQTYLTSHPLSAPIHTFQDLRRAKVSILLHPDEYAWMKLLQGGELIQSMQGIMELSKNFYEKRRSLNSSNAYPITTPLWQLIEEQQQYFSSKLFCRASELVFNAHTMFSVPLQKNSILKEPMEQLIANVKAFGLFDTWLRRTFYDLVSIGKAEFSDLNKREAYTRYSIADFHAPLMALCGGLIVSFVVFCCEMASKSCKNHCVVKQKFSTKNVKK